MERRSRSLLVGLVLLVGCGGGGGGGADEPISLLGVEGGGAVGDRSFTPAYGISFVRDSGTVSTLVGTGSLTCGTADGEKPPDGIYVEIQVPWAVVGTPTEHLVRFIEVSEGGVESLASNGGTVEVLAVSDASIELRVDYDQINPSDQLRYVLDGTFEVVRCP